MQKTITQEMVSELFTTLPLPDGGERTIYAAKFLHGATDTPERDLYELVSDYAYKSSMTHDFSYDVMSLACTVLADLPIWQGDDMPDNDDGLHEAIDGVVPVYNHELLKIATAGNYHLVDDALAATGTASIIEACNYAWYTTIGDAVRELAHRIEQYNNDNQ